MSNLAEVKKQVAGTPLVTIEDYLKKNEHLIVRALNNTISPERFLAVTNIVMQSPALMGCSQNSLVAAVLQTVQIGLTPGAIGHVYYVPFVNKGVKEVQLIVGYKGLVELVNRSKEASILNAECVFEKDQFQYEQGLNPILRHIPASGDRGEFVGVYAIAKNMMANEKVFVFLNKEEVQKVQNSSKAGTSEYSPWVKWTDEMRKKTAVKRLCKLLPLSVEVQQRISTDETVKMDIAPKMTDVPDKTDWNTAVNAEIVQPSVEKPAGMPQKQAESPVTAPISPEPTKAPTSQTSGLNEIVGALIGIVPFTRTRALDGKVFTGNDYIVLTQDLGEIAVSMFGSDETGGVHGTELKFTEITTKEFRGKTQYNAKRVEVLSAGKPQTPEEIWKE